MGEGAAPDEQGQQQRQGAQGGVQPSPPQPDGRGPCQQQGPCQHAHRARRRPTRHQLFVTCRVAVHQASLGEANKSAGGGVEEDKRYQQEGKGGGDCRQQQRGGKAQPTAHNQGASSPPIAQDAYNRLDHAGNHGWHAEEQSDLPVAQAQVGADDGPRCFARAKHHLIGKLDDEQQRSKRQHAPPCQARYTAARSLVFGEHRGFLSGGVALNHAWRMHESRRWNPGRARPFLAACCQRSGTPAARTKELPGWVRHLGLCEGQGATFLFYKRRQGPTSSTFFVKSRRVPTN